MKSEEGNDPLDTFIRQAIGKEPLLPFPKTGGNPVHWIQLLHALDQPDLLDWPLMTPVQVQMQKCEKCSQEFCSPINYRRHIRVHRRSLNVDKESHKKRDFLGAFWDKLSYEEVKEVVLFNGVRLKEYPGASVVRALASSLCRPGVWTLPQVYVRAGSSLLGIIQSKPPGWPISSQELFGILDDASERTFLCAGTPESVQKYLFDGETTKNILELKNLVASTSFLFEQQLVKAWVTDKDAEALRCQKLLVEEEEAAKRRLAELLERKKQKKQRQKEYRLNEKLKRCKGNFDAGIEYDATVLAESSSDSSSNWSNMEFEPESREKDSNEEWVQGGISGKKTEGNKCEVIAGSISIAVEGCDAVHPIDGQGKLRDSGDKESISCISAKGIAAVERGIEDSQGDVVLKKVGDSLVLSHPHGIGLEGILPFSTLAANHFLAERWKEAISADHVKLVLSTSSER